MSTLKIEVYLVALQKSDLIPHARLAEALEEFKQRFGLGSPSEVAVQPFSSFLMEQQLLTAWQHEKLLGGHCKGFYLGKYRLLRHLGSGGMSNVYLAEHRHMRRRVAIKVLPRSLSNNETYLKRFYLEARAIAALDHPNIVHAYGFDNEGGTHFMTMQFVEGTDLQQKVAAEGPLEPTLAARYIRQAANGLAHAHERGLIHRDMKPANLMVDHEGTVKLMDLGLAQMNFHASGLTTEQKGAVLGTADYLAPEQAIDSHNIDQRADLYSLGATFYFLLTGSPPFPRGTLAQRLMKHQFEEPAPIHSFRADVPEDLIEITRVLMAKQRDQRFGSAQEVVQVLEAWLTKQGGHLEPLGHSGSKAIMRRPAEDSAVIPTEEKAEPFPQEVAAEALVIDDAFDSPFGHPTNSSLRGTYHPPRKSAAAIYALAASILLLLGGFGFYLLSGDSESASKTSPLRIRIPSEGREEVSIQIDGQPQKFDASAGLVTFNLTPGSYRVSVNRDGYVPFERRIRISKEPLAPLQISWFRERESFAQNFDQNDLANLQVQEAPTPSVEDLPEVADTANAPPTLTLNLAPSVKMEFVYIRPGSFVMGGENTTESRFGAVEVPKHVVTLTKGFYLGKYEVTQAQYQAIMGHNPSRSTRKPNCPVDSTRWKQEIEFCEKVSRKTGRKVRLPTEAEWEYACRAGSSTPWSHVSDPSQLGEYAWIQANAGDGSKPVGQKKPNPWGLYDMHGNVTERVADRYTRGYYANSPKKDPTGAKVPFGDGNNGTTVLRGGTWRSGPKECRCGARLRGGGYAFYNNWGFRVAVSLQPEDSS